MRFSNLVDIVAFETYFHYWSQPKKQASVTRRRQLSFVAYMGFAIPSVGDYILIC